ncbi:MAG: hypothetical protein ABSG64_10690 [Solirubrobacteraceae bacterium]|jgi:hypothetical protein
MPSRSQLLLIPLAPALIAAAALAAPAGAATHTATCANLQARLNAASAGETLILRGSCSGSYTLPSGAAFTLEGATGTPSGFDGTGLTDTPELTSAAGSGVGAMTLSHLSFANADVTGSAVYLQHAAGALTLTDDSFTHDSTTAAAPVAIEEGSAGCAAADGRSLTVEGSSFANDTQNPPVASSTGERGGGGLEILIECGHDPVSLSEDEFTADTVNGAGEGGGLLVVDADSTVATVTQTANSFAGNTVSDSGAPSGAYGGGGEAVVGASLESTRERYTANTLTGTAGATGTAAGAGLALLGSGCAAAATQSTLADDVLAGNAIDDAGAPADAQGAALYAGPCGPADTSIVDSTISENSVTPAAAGGLAGIDAAGPGAIAIDNSILYGDQGGGELAGTNVAASYSDVCSGTAPFAGQGNICADPKLSDDGAPASINFHETATSPTIDAGSNALVPVGLTSDFYGAPRELSGASGACPQVAGSVDIGADEYSPCSADGPPKLSKLRLSAISFFAATGGGPTSPGAGSGTTISYSDSIGVTATIELFSVQGGVKRSGTCVAAKLGATGARCTLHVAIGSFTHADLAGANKVHFSGVLAGHALAGGLYQVRILATLDGVPSNTLKTEFDVF